MQCHAKTAKSLDLSAFFVFHGSGSKPCLRLASQNFEKRFSVWPVGGSLWGEHERIARGF
jgi:hypothetical protein